MLPSAGSKLGHFRCWNQKFPHAMVNLDIDKTILSRVSDQENYFVKIWQQLVTKSSLHAQTVENTEK